MISQIASALSKLPKCTFLLTILSLWLLSTLPFIWRFPLFKSHLFFVLFTLPSKVITALFLSFQAKLDTGRACTICKTNGLFWTVILNQIKHYQAFYLPYKDLVFNFLVYRISRFLWTGYALYWHLRAFEFLTSFLKIVDTLFPIRFAIRTLDCICSLRTGFLSLCGNLKCEVSILSFKTRKYNVFSPQKP